MGEGIHLRTKRDRLSVAMLSPFLLGHALHTVVPSFTLHFYLCPRVIVTVIVGFNRRRYFTHPQNTLIAKPHYEKQQYGTERIFSRLTCNFKHLVSTKDGNSQMCAILMLNLAHILSDTFTKIGVVSTQLPEEVGVL